MRRAIFGLLRVAGGLIIAVLSLVLHLGTANGRAALGDLVSQVIPGLVPGRLELRRILALSPSRVALDGVSWRDDLGHEVIRDAYIEVSPAWRIVSAAAGRGPWPKVLVRARRVWARVPVIGPQRVVTGQRAPEPSTPLTLTLPRMVLEVEQVDNALGGPPMVVRGLRGDISVSVVRDRPEITLRLLRGEVSLGALAPIQLDAAANVAGARSVSGHVDFDGLPLRCEIRASSASDDVSVDVRRCVLSSALLGVLSGSALAAIEVDHARLLRTRDDALSLEGVVRVQRDEFAVRAAMRGDRVSAELSPRHASLSWLGAGLPSLALDGTLSATALRRGTDWTLHASTLALRAAVEGVSVPGVELDARLDQSTLSIDSLRVPSLNITAQGSLDTASPASTAHIDLRARSTSLNSLMIPGVSMSGIADLDAQLRGSNAGVRASVNTRIHRFVGFDTQVASAQITATLALGDGQNPLSARSTLTGLRVARSGPIDATVELSGDVPRHLSLRARASGLLPREIAARLRAASFTASFDASARRDGGRTVIRVQQLQARAGGLALSASARARLRSDPRGTRAELVELSVVTPGAGQVDATLRDERLELRLAAIQLRAFATIEPELAPLGGIVSGHASVPLRDPGRSRVDLRVRELTAPVLGVISPHIEVIPGAGRRSALRLSVNAQGGPADQSELEVLVPQRLGSITGWIDGMQRGHLDLPAIDLRALRGRLPRGLRARGLVEPRLTFTRSDPEVLDVDASLEARELLLAAGVLNLERPLTVPLRARARACARVDTRRRFNDPVSIRVALGMESENRDASAFGCGPGEPALPTPLIDLSAGVEGPWRETLAAIDLASLRSPPSALLARMRAVPIRGRVVLGPLTRARWPILRARVPGLPASIRGLLQPELEPETRVAMSVDLGGTLAAPTVGLRADAFAPTLTQVGVTVPARAALEVDLRPSGESITTPIRARIAIRGALNEPATQADRGSFEATAQLSESLARLLDDPADASVESLHVAARNLRLEQISDLAARGVRGGLDVDLNRTADPARPFHARIALHEVRTIPPGLERIAAAIPPVNATLIGRVSQRDGDSQLLRACVLAGAGSAVSDCAPALSAEGDPIATGLLRADAEIPFPQGILHGPDLRELALSVRALNFRVDGLGALAPASTVTDLGGVISATLRWRASDPIRPVGRVELVDGRATLSSLGEPFDELNVAMTVEGRRVAIERFEGRLGAGSMRVTGNALVGRGDELVRVQLEARTNELPAVSNGHTWAWVTGAMGTELVVRRSGVFVDLRVHEARVRVQDEPARALIGMSPDPAVFVRGRTSLARPPAADAIPIDVAFTLETPMWLRRSDFVVAINGHGSVHVDRSGSAVAANFESARAPSWVSFYGKRFELERANITLDGSANINPQLDLVARHQAGGTVGAITLSLAGRLYDPRISLVAESDPDLGMAEVLSLLILGRRDNSATTGQSDLATQAGDMARSLVTGLTLGFVTSTLRAQFAFLPTLIAEPGTSDAGRYGAGFNLGPRVYLQATYGTASSGMSGGNGAQEFRVLLEYAMTTALSASLTYGTWPQFGTWQNNWGFDVFWSP